ncbi:beta strand repeat-containing protein [Desulfoluna spongiiphila]|uniref:beta strand repeat-containing protein n=1 Tax=Desulfoluna spongiiphila TaxID=419481 RepID=UPI001586FCDF|nr:Calx-beta domain-containing protein [Desulfoluna spongiiphila]
MVYSSVDTTPEAGEANVTIHAIGSGTGIFSESVGSLATGTLYYFRAYATNAVGTGYGTVAQFTTNTTPVISIADATLAYTENGGAVQTDSAATLSDADGDSEWNAGTLKAQVTANSEAADEVSISGTGVSVSGTDLMVSGTDVGDVSASGGVVTGGTALSITFDADATNAIVQNVLRSILYRNTSDDPGTSNRTLTVTATDSHGASASDTRTISLAAVNDPPTLSATGKDPEFSEDGAAAVLFESASVSTVEGGQSLAGLEVEVTEVRDATEFLRIDGTDVALTQGETGTTSGSSLAYGVTVSDTTATVSLSGGTLTTGEAAALVNAMAYLNSSDTPTASPDRVVTLTVLTDSGGTANGGTDTAALSVSSTVSVTAANDPPTAAGFTAAPIYQGTPYSFTTGAFGYGDVEGNDLDHLRIPSVPANGSLWVDTDGSGTINGSEQVLANNGTVSKADLDAGRFSYLNTSGTSSSFVFGVSDADDDSTSTYTCTLTVTAEPTVTLSLAPASSIDENGGSTNAKATLSHAFDKAVTVSLAFSGTAAGSGTDYTASGASITISSGSLSGTVAITGVDDVLDEADETVIVSISSVTNGSESGVQEETVTLTDDDAEPTVVFTSAAQASTDESGTLTLTAELSAVSGRAVTVPFTIGTGSTATGGARIIPFRPAR